MLYIFDSNVLIEAKNRYYGFDFVPGFWDFIEREAKKATLKSNDFVLEELQIYDDELKAWATEKQDLCFDISSDTKEIQEYYKEIVNYIMKNEKYRTSEKESFLKKADPWLIASAKYFEAILVTQEVKVPNDSSKIKIPNIAEHFKVKTINTFEMIRDLGGKFGLIE